MIKLRIRKHQHVSNLGVNQIIQCSATPPYIAEYINGTLVNPWIDVPEEDVEGLDALEFSYKESESGQKERDKGSTTSIRFTGLTSQTIKDWILGTPCSILNFWDVEIVDTYCGITYSNYVIKPDNIEWCLDDVGLEECMIEVPLREEDKKKSAFNLVDLTDDWQGWFNGKGGINNALKRDFPHIEVCVHNSPFQHGMSLGFSMFVLGFATIPNPFGSPIGIGTIIGSLFDFDESINKSMGFGNFAPCIPIRDILENALGKLNMTLDSGNPFAIGNEFQNDTVFYPSGGQYHNRTDASCQSPDLRFIWNNRDLTTLDEFLTELCKLYKMNWSVKNNKLYFKFKKDAFDLTPIGSIIDYESNCKSFSFEKRKGAGNYKYNRDPADQKTNKVEIAYNDRVDYDGNVTNELLEGKEDVFVKFAPVSFWGDGFGEDFLIESTYYGKMVAWFMYGTILFLTIMLEVTYLFPAIGAGVGAVAVTFPAQLVFLGATIAIMIASSISIFQIVSDIRDRFAYDSCHRGAVEIFGTGEISNHRIIRLEDNYTMNEAKPIEVDASTIVKNPRYNINNVDWKDQFSSGYWNHDFAFNFPLFFDANYFGELYNNYHEKVDNGLFMTDTNQSRTVTIPLCCENLELLGITDEDIAIGKVINIGTDKILIKEFTINYEMFTIEIKGKYIL